MSYEYPGYTALRGVTNVGASQASDIIESSVLAYLQWGFLGAGSFFNVGIPTSGSYGGVYHQLRPLSDPNYTDGQVWQGVRKDWVWETGVQYSTQPIRVSGVFVNGAFQPATGVGPYAHIVDYPNGRVVFTSPVSTGVTVACEHSFRWHQFSSADAPWFGEVQFGSFRPDDSHFAQWGSGNWDVLPQSRVQLPAVVVEATPNIHLRPHSLGSLDRIRTQEVCVHILTESKWDRKQTVDTLLEQWQKRILSFDKNRVLADGKYPLNYDGSPNSSGLMYPSLLKASGDGGYFWEQLRFVEMNANDYGRLGRAYYAVVRVGVEVDRP